MLLDSCLNLFVAANKDFAFSERIGASTRGSSAFPSFSFLKKCILGNCALNDANKLTRSSHEDAIKQPEFLMVFYNEFFNNEDVIRDSLEDEILKTINKVMASYPNLTDERFTGFSLLQGLLITLVFTGMKIQTNGFQSYSIIKSRRHEAGFGMALKTEQRSVLKLMVQVH